MEHATLYLYVVLGTAVGGFVQGLAGFAFGLVAMSFWAWSIPPRLAVPMLVFGSLFGQLLSVGTVRHAFDLRRALPFVAGGLIGVPIGVWLLSRVDPLWFKAGVGTLLALWCPFMLALAALPRIAWGGRIADAAAGVVGGVMGGVGGLTGPAPTLWCALRGWGKDEQRAVFQTFNISMQAVTLALYGANGILSAETARLFLIMAATLLVPCLVGARIYARLGTAAFQRLVLVLLALSGVALLATTIPRLVARW